MPQTRPSSSRVGATLNTIAERTKLMPLLPLSMVLERAPVCRFRWNVRSRLWRCLVGKMVQMRGKRDWRKTRT